MRRSIPERLPPLSNNKRLLSFKTVDAKSPSHSLLGFFLPFFILFEQLLHGLFNVMDAAQQQIEK
jgi:hypothetical protein